MIKTHEKLLADEAICVPKETDDLRIKIWNNMANIKFKGLYTSKCARKAQVLSNLISFIIAVVSSSSIAAWSIWNKIPSAWAMVIAASQFLHIAKQYIPSIKNENSFLEMSFEFETLFLDYEKLWYDYETKRFEVPKLAEIYHNLRKKELDIEKSNKSVFCPEPGKLIQKTQEEVYSIMNSLFNGGKNESITLSQLA